MDRHLRPTLLRQLGVDWKIGKGFLYTLPSIGPRADPSVQAVSPQVTISHPPGGRLPLLSARPAVTFPATEHHRPLASTKLYCLVTEAHRCEQLAQGCYEASPRVGFEPTTCWSQVQRSTRWATCNSILLSSPELEIWHKGGSVRNPAADHQMMKGWGQDIG